MSRIRTLSRLAVLALGLGSAVPAAAATCGITGSSTAEPAIYDPFSPGGLAATQVSLRLQRVNGGGGEKTDIVSFYLKSNNAGADGTSIVADSVAVEGNVTGLGLDIFYDYAQAPPFIPNTGEIPSTTNQFLRIAFTGNNPASDFATVNFTVRLPANLDLNATTTLPFDAYFDCSTTGGGGQTQQEGTISNAVRFPITVLSALQASFAGSALDFGEIGEINGTNLASHPNRQTSSANYVRVQSSGPYSVVLTSGGQYRMTPNGAAPAGTTDRVNYELRFLGETRSPSLTTQISKTCLRAGTGSADDRLHLQARLLEGGAGKVVSPTYRDTLTVTIAPLAATAGGGVDCQALAGSFP